MTDNLTPETLVERRRDALLARDADTHREWMDADAHFRKVFTPAFAVALIDALSAERTARQRASARSDLAEGREARAVGSLDALARRAEQAEETVLRCRGLAQYWTAEAERARGTGLYQQYRSRAEYLAETIAGTGYDPDDDERAALEGKA